MKLSNTEISSMRTMGEIREGRGDDLLARKKNIMPKWVSIEIETALKLQLKQKHLQFSPLPKHLFSNLTYSMSSIDKSTQSC